MATERMPWWAWAWPVAAWLTLLTILLVGIGGLMTAVAGTVLVATVFAAVYHAEVVAHRVLPLDRLIPHPRREPIPSYAVKRRPSLPGDRAVVPEE